MPAPALPFGLPAAGYLAPLGSPLLANIYLHWFDHIFHAKTGPAHWAKAVLVRCADDFVILSRAASDKLVAYVETKLESWLGLKINREKTRVKDLRKSGESLDFVGYNFRLDRDKYGRRQKYWNMSPSGKTVIKEREKNRRIINKSKSHQPLPELIEKLNRHLQGWASYYRPGYSRKAFRQINKYVREKLERHLQRRSQRAWKPKGGESPHNYFARMKLIYL